jgi:hypothetical protein
MLGGRSRTPMSWRKAKDRSSNAGIFTPNKPVIFNFHSYPWLIDRLTYSRPGQHNIHVRGYKEKGNINTPLELATVSRRLSRRRVTAAGRRACGQSGEASARDSGQRSDFLKRAHSARTKRSLAGTEPIDGRVLPAEHSELERAQLRTQFIPASNSTLERHKSRGLAEKQCQHLLRL